MTIQSFSIIDTERKVIAMDMLAKLNPGEGWAIMIYAEIERKEGDRGRKFASELFDKMRIYMTKAVPTELHKMVRQHIHSITIERRQ